MDKSQNVHMSGVCMEWSNFLQTINQVGVLAFFNLNNCRVNCSSFSYLKFISIQEWITPSSCPFIKHRFGHYSVLLIPCLHLDKSKVWRRESWKKKKCCCEATSGTAIVMPSHRTLLCHRYKILWFKGAG